MTALIEKLAFMPPRTDNAKANLPGKVGFVTSSLGHRVSFMDLIPSAPERCLATGPSEGPSQPYTRGCGLFSPRYTMLFAHVNASDLSFEAHPLSVMADSLGIRIVAYDYPGYGLSEDVSPSAENAIAAEEAMFLYLTQQVGIPRERLIVCGRSVGGGPSTWLASRQPGLAALILICTFKSIAQVAGTVAGVIGAAIDIFPNLKRIKKVRDTPVLIVHGDEDRLVGYEHGKALYKAALEHNPAGAQLITIPGAGHNNLDYKNPQLFFGGIRAFLNGIMIRRAEQALANAGATPKRTVLAQWQQQQGAGEDWTTNAPTCMVAPAKPRPHGPHHQHGVAHRGHQQNAYHQQQQQMGVHPQQLQQQHAGCAHPGCKHRQQVPNQQSQVSVQQVVAQQRSQHINPGQFALHRAMQMDTGAAPAGGVAPVAVGQGEKVFVLPPSMAERKRFLAHLSAVGQQASGDFVAADGSGNYSPSR